MTDEYLYDLYLNGPGVHIVRQATTRERVQQYVTVALSELAADVQEITIRRVANATPTER